MKEIKLPSGAVLKITPSPFKAAKALYQAILKEGRGVEVSTKTEMSTLFKDLFCTGFSSPQIEECLWACFQRCTYNGGNGDLRISDDTFEPIQARDDYFTVCVEVAKENVGPFVKSLYAEYQRFIAMMPTDLA